MTSAIPGRMRDAHDCIQNWHWPFPAAFIIVRLIHLTRPSAFMAFPLAPASSATMNRGAGLVPVQRMRCTGDTNL
jgi:hypothetical protein